MLSGSSFFKDWQGQCSCFFYLVNVFFALSGKKMHSGHKQLHFFDKICVKFFAPSRIVAIIPDAE
jgi:hypothetical protein